ANNVVPAITSMPQSRQLQRVVEISDGPYRGDVTRVELDARVVWYRPPGTTHAAERYRIVDVGFGIRELRHAPRAAAVGRHARQGVLAPTTARRATTHA